MLILRTISPEKNYFKNHITKKELILKNCTTENIYLRTKSPITITQITITNHNLTNSQKKITEQKKGGGKSVHYPIFEQHRWDLKLI